MRVQSVVKYLLVLALMGYAFIIAYFYIRQDFLTFYAKPEYNEPMYGLSETKVETEDGETLIAWTQQATEGCPTVLLFHGQWTTLSRHKKHYEAITSNGLGLYALAWRGFSGSTGKPSETGLHLDAATAYKALIEKGLSPDEIVVHGISLGTGPATRLASEQDVAALILEAPYRSTVSVAQERYPYLPISLLAKYSFKSEDWIGDVVEPVLIGHGTADEVIPFQHGRDLFESANDPKTFASFEGVDHISLVENGFYEDAIWPFLTPNFPDCTALTSKELLKQ